MSLRRNYLTHRQFQQHNSTSYDTNQTIKLSFISNNQNIQFKSYFLSFTIHRRCPRKSLAKSISPFSPTIPKVPRERNRAAVLLNPSTPTVFLPSSTFLPLIYLNYYFIRFHTKT
jgi:hypothetical protein